MEKESNYSECSALLENLNESESASYIGAFTLMEKNFGEEALLEVSNLVKEFNTLVTLNISKEEIISLGEAGLIGGIVGATAGIFFTIYLEHLEKKCTGHSSVPAAGIPCAVLPVSASIGALSGMALKLLLTKDGK